MASNAQSRQATETVMSDPEYKRLIAAYNAVGRDQPDSVWQEIAAKISQRVQELTGIPANTRDFVVNPRTGEVTTDTKWKNAEIARDIGVNALWSWAGGNLGPAGKTALPAVSSYLTNQANSSPGTSSNTPGSPSSTSPNYTDPKKALDYFGSTGESRINDLRNSVNNRTQGLESRFNSASDQADSDYGNIQSQYQSFMKSNPISYTPSHQDFGAYSGYQNFADTGGYSQQDQQNIRARANAPIRATYANAQNDLTRRNVLAGGNLANASAAKAKMSRELSYSLGDQSLNTEASLAEAIRNGKLAGLSGMTGIDTNKMGEGLANSSNNLQAQGMESNRLLNAMQGQTSLYGATPGRASMYGNQMLSSSGQNLQVEQLHNQLAQAIINGSLGRASQPSGLQTGLGNTASILNLIGQGASLYNSYRNGSSGTLPSRPTTPNSGTLPSGGSGF